MSSSQRAATFSAMAAAGEQRIGAGVLPPALVSMSAATPTGCEAPITQPKKRGPARAGQPRLGGSVQGVDDGERLLADLGSRPVETRPQLGGGDQRPRRPDGDAIAERAACSAARWNRRRCPAVTSVRFRSPTVAPPVNHSSGLRRAFISGPRSSRRRRAAEGRQLRYQHRRAPAVDEVGVAEGVDQVALLEPDRRQDVGGRRQREQQV